MGLATPQWNGHSKNLHATVGISFLVRVFVEKVKIFVIEVVVRIRSVLFRRHGNE